MANDATRIVKRGQWWRSGEFGEMQCARSGRACAVFSTKRGLVYLSREELNARVFSGKMTLLEERKRK